jgi:serine/threonine-protein kinase RsbW
VNGRIVASHHPDDGGVFLLSLPVDIASVEQGRLALRAYLRRFALDDRVINRLEVVLEELISNVVCHAKGANSLSVEAEHVDRGVRLTIEDDGPAFNPFEAPEPASFGSLEDAPLGGQGIPLIMRLSKSVRYDRIAGLNRVCVGIAVS